MPRQSAHLLAFPASAGHCASQGRTRQQGHQVLGSQLQLPLSSRPVAVAAGKRQRLVSGGSKQPSGIRTCRAAAVRAG